MTGTTCYISSCKNNYFKTKKNGHAIMFFTFPKDMHIQQEWMRRCNRKNKFHPKYKRVCSRHFTDDDYEDIIRAKLMNVPPKKLKATAVPSLHLSSEDEISKRENESDEETVGKDIEQTKSRHFVFVVEKFPKIESVFVNCPVKEEPEEEDPLNIE